MDGCIEHLFSWPGKKKCEFAKRSNLIEITKESKCLKVNWIQK